MDQQTLDEFTEEQASDDSEVRCPTCGRTDFQSKRGIKTHHAKTHGQKLVLVSEDELIDAMRALGEGAPTREEMRTDGKYAPKKYKHKFGSWNEALEAAGYEPRTQHQPITQSELLRSLETLADELGRSPSQLDINEHSKHSAKTYYRKFDGGLEEAKRRVGLEHYEQQSKDRVTVYCAHCDTEIEKTPSELAVSEYHYCSQNCLNEHKKERYSAPDSPIPNTLKPVDCEACGSSIYKAKWEREKKERHYCSDCWGNSKVPIECEQCGEMELVWPAVADKRRFCSPDCKDEWQGEEIRGENHPRYRGGYEQEYYGPNYDLQRQKAIIRDQARCQDCRLTETQSLEQFGEELSMHHITPVREFIVDGELNYKQANQLDNLVTLCRPCHSKRETELEYTDY